MATPPPAPDHQELLSDDFGLISLEKTECDQLEEEDQVKKDLEEQLKLCLDGDSNISTKAKNEARKLIEKVFDGMEDEGGELSESQFVQLGCKLFEDLCLFADKKKLQWLDETTKMKRVFSLELLYLVTCKYGTIISSHDEFKDAIIRLLTNSLQNHQKFPVMVRLLRITQQFISHFHLELRTVCKTLLNLLIKFMDCRNAMWQRCLALEVLRNLCSNKDVLRSFMKPDLYDTFKDTIDAIHTLTLNLFVSPVKSEITETSFAHRVVLMPIKSIPVSETISKPFLTEMLDKWESPSIHEDCALRLVFDTVLDTTHTLEFIVPSSNKPKDFEDFLSYCRKAFALLELMLHASSTEQDTDAVLNTLKSFMFRDLKLEKPYANALYGAANSKNMGTASYKQISCVRDLAKLADWAKDHYEDLALLIPLFLKELVANANVHKVPDMIEQLRQLYVNCRNWKWNDRHAYYGHMAQACVSLGSISEGSERSIWVVLNSKGRADQSSIIGPTSNARRKNALWELLKLKPDVTFIAEPCFNVEKQKTLLSRSGFAIHSVQGKNKVIEAAIVTEQNKWTQWCIPQTGYLISRAVGVTNTQNDRVNRLICVHAAHKQGEKLKDMIEYLKQLHTNHSQQARNLAGSLIVAGDFNISLCDVEKELQKQKQNFDVTIFFDEIDDKMGLVHMFNKENCLFNITRIATTKRFPFSDEGAAELFDHPITVFEVTSAADSTVACTVP